MDVEKRVGQHLEESTRNKAREQYEEAQRQQESAIKAVKAIKFEMVFKSLFTRNLQTATLNALKDVAQPIYNPEIAVFMLEDENERMTNFEVDYEELKQRNEET